MKDLNKAMLTGRLGADPIMKFTPNGATVTTFNVASNRRWKDASGETHEDTEWFSVVAWNKLAEICNEYLSKGSRVYIEGRLQTRSWDDAESGQKRYKTEVVADDMIILDGRKEAQPAEEAYDEPEPEPVRQPAREPVRAARPTQPAQRPAQPARRPMQGQAPREKLELEEEDIPF